MFNKKPQHARCQSHLDSRFNSFQKMFDKVLNNKFTGVNNRIKELEKGVLQATALNCELNSRLRLLESYLKVEIVAESSVGYKKVTKKK